MPDLRDDMTGGPLAPPEAQAESFSKHQSSTLGVGATVILRVAEARVEDVGHAIARLAPADMRRIGAKRLAPFVVTRGDFLTVLEAERSSPKHSNAANEPGSPAGDSSRDVFTSTKY